MLRLSRVCVYSYNPKLSLYKIFDRNIHRTPGNIVRLSSKSSAFEAVGPSSIASAAEGEVCRFKLSETTELKIQRGDITQWFVDGSSDAIVGPANERMLGGGGANGAIHAAAGPELLEACYEVPEVEPDMRCPTGEARITPGFKLPAAHVIHTVGPIYDFDEDPKASLTSAYKNSLTVAKENNIQYIAFTAISCGVYGRLLQTPYLLSKNLEMEVKRKCLVLFGFTILQSKVHFVVFSDQIYNVWLNKAKELLQA